MKKPSTLDPDNALAFQGLSNVYRRQGIEPGDRGCGTASSQFAASSAAGAFQSRCGHGPRRSTERAILAFETALRFAPEMHNAHRYLATLHRANGGDRKKAAFHRAEAAKSFGLDHDPRRRSTTNRSEKLFDLPEIPKREERLEILLKERPDPKPPEKKSDKTFILVSGLPRSGTSLMMQLLEAGGVKVLTDKERAADIDNPHGYYEWEAIKQIAKKPELLDEEGLEGRAIKCISMLLPADADQTQLQGHFHDPANRRSRRVAECDGESPGHKRC